MKIVFWNLRMTENELLGRLKKCGSPQSGVLARICCGVLFALRWCCRHLFSCEDCRAAWTKDTQQLAIKMLRYINKKRLTPLWITLNLPNRTNLANYLTYWKKTVRKLKNYKIYEGSLQTIIINGLRRYKQNCTDTKKYIWHENKCQLFRTWINNRWRVDKKGRKYICLSDIVNISLEVFEVKKTFRNKGWNLHLHAFWGARVFFPQPILTELLRIVSREANAITYIKPISRQKQGEQQLCDYISDYVGKVIIDAPQDVLEADRVFFRRKKRTISGKKKNIKEFKHFREKLEQLEKKPCPHCQEEKTSVEYQGEIKFMEDYDHIPIRKQVHIGFMGSDDVRIFDICLENGIWILDTETVRARRNIFGYLRVT